MAPVDENWPIFKVSRMIGKFSSYEQAISAERLTVQSSESEDALERGPGKRKIKINKFVHSPPPREGGIFSNIMAERTDDSSKSSNEASSLHTYNISPIPSCSKNSSAINLDDGGQDQSNVTMIMLDNSVTNSDIMKKLIEMQATLSMMTSRLNTLEVEAKNKYEIMVGEDLIKDYLPLTDLAQLLKFDDLIKSNNEAFEQLVQKYLQYGGKNEADFLRRILSLTLSNSLATFCSWTGQKNNFRIKDSTFIRLMRGTVRKVFPTFSDCLFDKIAMEWLRHAKQRLLRET